MNAVNCSNCGIRLYRNKRISYAKCDECKMLVRVELSNKSKLKAKTEDICMFHEKQRHLVNAYRQKHTYSMFVGHQRKWTEGEIEFLESSTLPDKSIAKRLSRSVGGIRAKRARLRAGETE